MCLRASLCSAWRLTVKHKVVNATIPVIVKITRRTNHFIVDGGLFDSFDSFALVERDSLVCEQMLPMFESNFSAKGRVESVRPRV